MAIVRRYLPPQLSEKILAARGRLDGERKQVTVLFADMKGYTPLAEALGEEGAYQLMEQVYAEMIPPVHDYEGTVQELTGDGILALFGAPVAIEDAPVRACRAALEIQSRMRALGAKLQAERGVRPQVRIGIHTGPVVVGTVGADLKMEFKAVGDTVNLAARLESMAEPGTILISEATGRLVEGYVESSFLGEREVKGKAEAQRVYRLERLKPGAVRFDASLRRGLTPLVGRRREVEALERCYHEARGGTVRVVNLVGEAGLGKSRLLHELRQQIEHDQVFLLQGHCTAYGRSTSFLPLIQVVRGAFRLGEQEGREEIARKLERGLELLGMSAEVTVPFVLNLLGHDPGPTAFQGLDGEIVGARTREILHEFLRARCKFSPVMLVVDDLHWTDTASEELLLRVVQTEERLPLLVLCAYRPDYRPPWADHPRVVELRIEPLAEEACLQLVQRQLGIETLSAELARLIVDTAAGNPLFAEELARYLAESGSAPARGVPSHPSGGALALPGTVQDLVMARVDRLGEGPRALLQVASVIGRRFPVELVQVVAGVNGHLPDYLHALEAQELIVRQEQDGREEYHFKHALVQDAVYESLLTPRREEIHQRAAEAIERIYADRLGEWTELLAHHWSRTSRNDKAVRYLARAGEKSLRVYSLEEAHKRFREVLERLERFPGCADESFLAELLLSWARVYYYQKDFKGLIALVERYLPRIEALGENRHLSLLLFWLGFSHCFGARFEIAKSLIERALAIGEALRDDECIGYACLGLMWVHLYSSRGQPADIVERLGARALEIAGRSGDVYLGSKCYLCLVLHNLQRGRPNEARNASQRLLDLGRGAGDPRTIAMGLYTAAFVNGLDERYEEAIEEAEESLRISPDMLDRLTARQAKGMALALMGQSGEGLGILQDVRRELVAGDLLITLTGLDIPCGAAMALTGEIAAGVRWIEEAMQRFSGWGSDSWVVFGHMILGEIYLQMALGEKKPPLGVIVKNLVFLLRTLPVARRKARYHLAETIRLSRQLDLPYFVARALLDLSVLSKANKRFDEARTYLEEALTIAEPHSATLHGKIRSELASLPR